MAHSYTPGLKVTPEAVIKKRRVLPLRGEVMVEVGDQVTAMQVVARTELPGAVFPVKAAQEMGVDPGDLPGLVKKAVGDQVSSGEVIAESKGLFGLFRSAVKSPIDGSVEAISKVTGQIILNEAPIPVEVSAYVDGEVIEVIPEEGVVVRTYGTFIQGIFGIGGEAHGELAIACDEPSQPLTADRVSEEMKDKVIVGGSFADLPAISKAIEVGVAGIVVGGFDYADIKKLLGYEIGVAITGAEDLGLTLVVTEGFGQIAMAGGTFDLFKENTGQPVSINGATQIRAGVIRPEVIISKPPDADALAADRDGEVVGIEIGAPVRIIRAPYFGKLAAVTSLPEQLQVMPSGTKVRVFEVEFPGGEVATLPRANVERIEK